MKQDGVWIIGQRDKCACGASFKLHCDYKPAGGKTCGWYRCSRQGCSGLFEVAHKRHSIFREHMEAG